MELAIRTKTIIRAMVIAVVFLTLAGLASRFALYTFGDGPFLRPVSLFDVGAERSIPTWFESMQFMLCSILLAVIALAKKQSGDRYSRHWGVLSVVLAYMSLDETATIHETVGAELGRVLSSTTGFIPSGAISYFWVVPGALFVVILGLSYIGFLVHLPRSTRRLFLFAAATFFLGALLLDMLSAQLMSSSGAIGHLAASASGGRIDPKAASAIPKILNGGSTSLQEMFEMLGLTAFVYALLAYISSYVDEDIAVRVSTDKSG